MQKLHGLPGRERTVIIVAPPGAVVHVVRRHSHREVIAFASSDEFEAWAAGGVETIRREVFGALAAIGCRLGDLSWHLRALLESIAAGDRVPALQDLEGEWPSRRSFYREWSASVAEPPSAFLRRVRALHARRLLGNGATRKSAAAVAGFSSVDAMRRRLGARD
ncbi:MAG TPA: hypothetical protein VKH35_16925 [Thermoanaerobaculia bacterium]|jgi:hypothetical protein|nr:hypothetical protein [Thermoanaerobaculia bacterium]